MKIITKTTRLFAVLILLLAARTGFSQPPCTFTVGSNTGLNGSVSFNATFPGGPPLGTGTFNWTFGNGLTASQTVTYNTTTATTYTANGIYTVTVFYVNATSGCSTTVTQTISITNATTCSLTPNFTATASYNGGYIFNSYSSGGTVAGTTHTWKYGDGSTASSGTTTTSFHTYTAAGVYSVTLILNNNFTPACIDSVVKTVTVCAIPSTLTAVPGANGASSFTLNSSATNASTQYAWFWGDATYVSGTNGTGPGYATATHNYYYNGTYSVGVNLINPGACSVAVTTTVAISTASGGACVPNSNFTLTPSGTPQLWNAYPAITYTANLAGATWDWGDNSTSNTLFTSHTYSAAGNYSICLTVTVICSYGYTNTATCYSYNVYRSNQDMSMVQINVLRSSDATGIKNNLAANADFMISPNPGNGHFNLKIDGLDAETASIAVYDLVGKQVYKTSAETGSGSLNKNLQLDQVSDGVYFIKVNAGSNIYTKKIVISRE